MTDTRYAEGIKELKDELRVYTTDEIAETFKKDPHTIRRWIHSGKLKAKKIGGVYYVRREEIARLIEI